MEKLIELFRDYVESYGNDTKDPTTDNAVVYDGQGFYFGARFYPDEKVLSKKFGFIKWLVENDKIDREKVKEKSDRIPLLLDKVGDIYNCGVLKSVLMLLSISDTPINDLISYLK